MRKGPSYSILTDLGLVLRVDTLETVKRGGGSHLLVRWSVGLKSHREEACRLEAWGVESGSKIPCEALVCIMRAEQTLSALSTRLLVNGGLKALIRALLGP